jgi:hypothetical protein
VPILADSFDVYSAASNSDTLTTPSFTPQLNDVIVVKGIIETTSGSVHYNTPTDTLGSTYTLVASDATALHCWVGLWCTTVSSSTSLTVSLSGVFGSGQWHSMVVEDWYSAATDGVPATNGTVTGSSSPSSSLTTTQPRSAVSWLNGDWNAVSPSGRVYDSTSSIPTENGLHDKPTSYTAYYAWQIVGSPGSQTIGLTSPGAQEWSMLGMEILDVPSGTPSDQDQFRREAWQ